MCTITLSALSLRQPGTYTAYVIGTYDWAALQGSHMSGRKEDMSASNIACGWATFSASALPDVLRLWARVATPDLGFEPAPPGEIEPHCITIWADAVQSAQERSLHAGPTGSYVRHDEANRTIILGWEGIWTQGRWIEVLMQYDDAGIGFIRLSWDTATGKPSAYLGLEGILKKAQDWGDT